MGKIEYEKIEFNNKIIIKRTFSGTITVTEIINSFQYLVDNEIKKNTNINAMITDITDSDFSFSIDDMRDVLSMIKNDKKLSNMGLAVLVNSPIKTVFPTIASYFIGINVKPFSTLKGAIEWAKNF